MRFLSRKSKEPIRKAHLPSDSDAAIFRRSRTLTGAASSDVRVATDESRSHLKSPRTKTHELKHHRRLLGLLLVGVVVLSGGCVWLLDQYIIRADTVVATVSPTRPIVIADYQKVFDEYLDAKPMQRFRFLLNGRQLNEMVQSRLPEVGSIEVADAPGLATTTVTIDFRRPVAVWQLADASYYVDASGQTFSKNYYPEPAVSVNDESGLAAETSQVVASNRLLRFLGQTVAGLNAAQIGTVNNVTIPAGTLRQLDITIDTQPYRIKTHMDREAVGQVYDIVSAVNYLSSKQLTPEYVDVRVKGKAFYR